MWQFLQMDFQRGERKVNAYQVLESTGINSALPPHPLYLGRAPAAMGTEPSL